MKNLFKSMACFLMLLCVYPGDSRADPPEISAGQDIGAQAERFRQEYSLEKQMFLKKEKPSLEFEEKARKPAASGATFELKEIRIVGMTILNPDHLYSIWKPYVGQQVSLEDLQMIADKIKEVYKEFGYLTSMTFIPEQDIKDGVVEIHAAEGKMGALRVDGNHHFTTRSIERYFHTYPNQILNIQTIQKDIMRLNENPDLTINAILSAGEKPETSDITLKVKETRPYHAWVGFDNQGTRLTGRYRRSAVLNSSNLTGHQDLLYLNTIVSDRSFGEYGAYQLPVGTNGAKLGLDVGYFQLKLGKELEEYDVTGATKIYNPNFSWEVYRSENLQTNAHAGIKIKDIKKHVGRTKTNDEQLRLPYWGLDVIRTDATGQTYFSPELNFGTSGFLGASSKDNRLASREGTGGFFTKYEQALNRSQRMPWDSYMQIRTNLQASPYTLSSSEQFQLGGTNSVRGYPEGDFLADTGGHLSADWIFPMYVIPKDWRLIGSDINLRHVVEPVVFADVGGGFLVKNFAGEAKDKFLAGAGGGFRIHIKKNLFAKLEWAQHLGDKPVKGAGSSTFGVSVQMGM